MYLVAFCSSKLVHFFKFSFWEKRVLSFALLDHSHKKRKDSLETGLHCWYFRLNLKYLGWPYRKYIKTAEKVVFCEEFLNENDFEAVLATFCCYDYGANSSEAVRKIAKDQKDYPKCSSCVAVCWIAKIYQSITVKKSWLLTY